MVPFIFVPASFKRLEEFQKKFISDLVLEAWVQLVKVRLYIMKTWFLPFFFAS